MRKVEVIGIGSEGPRFDSHSLFLLASYREGAQRKCRGSAEEEREREREEEKKKNIIDARLLARQQAGRNAGRCSDRQLGKQARLNHSTPEAGK